MNSSGCQAEPAVEDLNGHQAVVEDTPRHLRRTQQGAGGVRPSLSAVEHVVVKACVGKRKTGREGRRTTSEAVVDDNVTRGPRSRRRPQNKLESIMPWQGGRRESREFGFVDVDQRR